MSFSIEFVGLPGVGKSTLSNQVSEALVNENFQVTEPIRSIDDRSTPHRVLSKIRFVAEHFVRRPRTSFRTSHTLIQTDQDSVSDFVRVAFNLHYVAGVIVHARSGTGVTLFDQGPYQGVWSIGLRSTIDWDLLLDRFTRFLAQTAPDLIVFVEADTDTIVDRLHSREDGNTRFDPDTLSFERGIEGYRSLKTRVRSRSESPRSIVIQNETHADLNAAVERIVASLNSFED